jgi:hypothetical protein
MAGKLRAAPLGQVEGNSDDIKSGNLGSRGFYLVQWRGINKTGDL